VSKGRRPCEQAALRRRGERLDTIQPRLEFAAKLKGGVVCSQFSGGLATHAAAMRRGTRAGNVRQDRPDGDVVRRLSV
jgi:hypothetical protein